MKRKTTPTMKRHELGRPPGGCTEVLALLRDGRWVADDGRPHVSFSCKEGGWPMAIWSDCSCSLSDSRCPGRRAMDETCARWGCANGRSFRR